MTKDQLAKATGMERALAERWYPHLVKTFERFGIDTPKRQAHFLAQVGTESGGFKRCLESMNYSVEGLKIFGSRLTPAQREQLGRKAGESALSPARQEAIANIVYGGRYGNNLDGDGWKYRGRGLKQVTFRDNYDSCGKALGVDLLANPDLLARDEYAALSAGWFWQANGCNKFADAGDINGLTKRINGGFNGLTDRQARTIRAEDALL